MEYHVPVMLAESIEGLNLRPDGTYVDATFGGGGHSRAIMERLGDGGRLYAFDQDEDALPNAIDDARFTLLNENFKHLKSYRRQEYSAFDVVNTLPEENLKNILSLYGELPNAGAMAHAIATARKKKDIETTFELRDAVQRHLPRQQENKFLAMLFQAVRIEVNGELEALKDLLKQASEILKPGGRLVVISYHSLEDRLVKNFMKTGNFEGELKKDFYGNPLVPFKVVSRKAVTPSADELERNNRSRSAKLRIAEKISQEKENID